MNSEVRLFTVYGRVQGVWFRDSTRREAQRLEITGHAINLQDGNVEVLACGTPEALRELEEWLHTGPPVAQVSRVESVSVDHDPPAGFRVG